ncbi:MAG: hypothetical protein V4714_02440 [Bacteroidota bacterium]
MVEDLSNASWNEIFDHPQVLLLDSRKPIYISLPHSNDTFVIELNRTDKSLSFAKTQPSNSFQTFYQVTHFPYLLVNPDFEKLKILLRIDVNAERNSIELKVVKPADNSLFELIIHQLNQND